MRDPLEESIRMRRAAALAARIAETRERIAAHQTQLVTPLATQLVTKEREPKIADLSISGEHQIAAIARALPQAEARLSTPPPAPSARPSMLYASEPIIRFSTAAFVATPAPSRRRVLLVPVLAIAVSVVSYWAVSAWVASASVAKQLAQHTKPARSSDAAKPAATLTISQPMAAATLHAPEPQRPHAQPSTIAAIANASDARPRTRPAAIATASEPNIPALPKHPMTSITSMTSMTSEHGTPTPRAVAKSTPAKAPPPAVFERIAMGAFPSAADGGGASSRDTNRPRLQIIVPVSTIEPAAAAPSAVTAHADELAIRGSLHSAGVERAIDRILPQLAACEARLANGARSDTALRVEMVVDVVGRVRNPLVSGAASLDLERCLSVATAAKFVSKPPDTGTARVSWRLRFTP